MYNVMEGTYTGKDRCFCIIVSRFNDFITGKLLDGSLDCLKRHETNESSIDIIWVPGAFEIPLLAKKAALTGKYNAVICLGAVIRGSTPHFDYVCAEVSKGIASIGLETLVPVIHGVITANTIEQAIERSGTKAGNKGWDAALSALEMADLMTK